MFQKGFPLEDVEKKTDIKVEERDGEFWLKKGENVILTKVKNGIIHGLTRYGENSISEVMNKLVVVFQTKFITDNEEEMVHHDPEIDVDKLFDDTTTEYGYTISEKGDISITEE